jgi:hypothetical protein
MQNVATARTQINVCCHQFADRTAQSQRTSAFPPDLLALR